jgi:hypothetical protein
MKQIGIHSVPRSGSTWLGEVFNSSENVKYAFQPLFSYSLRDSLSEDSSHERVDSFFQALLESKDEFLEQSQARANGTLPRVGKKQHVSHIVYKEVRFHNLITNILEIHNSVKFIFLIRDPVEVMNSWINAGKEFSSEWNVNDELFNADKKNLSMPSEFYGLNKWIQATELFEKLRFRFPNRVRIVTLNKLLQDPVNSTKSLFSFCDLPFSKNVESFILKSRGITISGDYSVFRKIGYRARIVLTEKQIMKIRDEVENSGFSHYLNIGLE